MEKTPHKSEAFESRVILEALYFQLPIITTPVNGIKEQVSELCASFYDCGDIEKLKKLIIQYKNEEFRNSKKDNCAQQFNSLTSYEIMLEKYKECFIEAYLSGVSR